MTDQKKTMGEKYLEFLIENEYWPNSFSYAVTYQFEEFEETGESIPATENTYEIKKLRRVGDKECLAHMEMGFMCNIPIKIEAIESYTKMIKFKVKYFEYEHELNVYAPLKVSPSEFYDRVRYAVGNYFRENIKTGHPHFEDFKNYFVDKKKSFFKPIGEALKKLDDSAKEKNYKKWLDLREQSKNNEDEPGYGLCYCGHTHYCECADPSEVTYQESVKNGTIIPDDPSNGWTKLNDD
jgi:hypothetical protein